MAATGTRLPRSSRPVPPGGHTMSYPDPYDPHPAPRKRADAHTNRWAILALAAVLGVGLGALGYWGGKFLVNRLHPQPPATNPDAQPREAVANGPLDAEEAEANHLFERVKDSVVSVNTVLQRRGRVNPSTPEGAGGGGGVVWGGGGRGG